MRILNSKEICKQIKYFGSRHLIWSRKQGHHYITNRHWMIRFTDDQMPREVLVSLFSVYADIPKEGRAFVIREGEQNEVDAVNVQSIYASFQESIEGEVTPFIKDLGDIKMRVVRCDGEIIYINESYSKMLDMADNKPLCKGKGAPVFFLDGMFLILPYRNQGDNDKSIIDELIAG